MHRRDPGVGLRGPDAARGGRADRAGRGRGRAGDLRLRGVPEPGARADRPTRPASSTSTSCATTTCPGEPGDAEHSWLGLMLFDYITMTEALGGDAVGARGRRGAQRRPRRGASTRSERARVRRARAARPARRRHVRLRRRLPCSPTSTCAIAAGQFTGIVGPSGSGKTTLLRVLLGTVGPIAGTVAPPAGTARRLRAAGRDGRTGTSR